VIKIEFSPNGNYFFQISTSSPRATADFTTHIYNASTGEEISVIQNSTMPSWIDNQRIVFRKYVKRDSPENGLYIYDITLRSEMKLEGTPVDSYNPEALLGEGKMVFWTDLDKKLWFYDLKSREKKLLVGNAIHGLWASPTQIVFEQIEPCIGREECGMVDYKIQSVSLYDFELGKETESIPELQSIYGAASLYH